MFMLTSIHRRLMSEANMKIIDLSLKVISLKMQVERAPVREVGAQFTPEQLRKMVQLCHPDKHNGSKLAVEVTQLLNAARK